MFCKNCGHELNDGAYVCTNCGCLANGGTDEVVPTVTQSNAVDKKELLLKIFLLIAFGLSCVVFLFLMLAVANMEIFVEVDMDYSSYFDYYYFTESVTKWLGDTAVIGFIVAFPTLGAGITAFVLGLKNSDKMLKLMSILCLMLTVTMSVVATLFFLAC